MNRIILASASPRRRELLHQIDLEPEIIPSAIEEKITKTEPDLVVMELSEQKAMDVAETCRGTKAFVIGADTVVAFGNRILGKPHSEEEAFEMISSLQGNTHQVYTGVTVIDCQTGARETFAERTEVQVYPMEDGEIRNYIATKEPMDKAGAYGIQGRFAAYIQGIHGDYNNVVGLPVGRVYQTLKRMKGISV
ncbi:MAG: septum formation inhibitor Maf [Clostridiaceae bacterium]|nr:septum formation inhibitor Maf [Clostridiaceae bacterium]